MKRRLKSIKLKAGINADEAWMYVNEKSIEVLVYKKGSNPLSCRITERQLRSLLTPTEGRESGDKSA
jgi:hypothetical protein